MPLTVRKLSIGTKHYEIVKDAFLEVKRGERVAVVGESGSGKSLTAFSVLKLLSGNLHVSGKINVDGIDVNSLEGENLRKFRWEKVSLVFQDPSASLDPLMKVKEQIGEALLYHKKLRRKQIEERVWELLHLAEVPEPEERMNAYPHQLSGGLKQRVAIAMALACEPDYIIADEPTTALDVTIQSRILNLLKKLSIEECRGILLITHDMGVVAEFAEKLFVMYAGYTVESGKTEEIFRHPLHPYTKGLIECSPTLDGGRKRKLFSIPGNIPEPSKKITGCPFHPRCPKAKELCKVKLPPMVDVEGRKVRCFFTG